MTTLQLFQTRLAEDRHLAVLVTTHPQQSDPQISVVNATVIDHPITNKRVVAFVARPGKKLVNLRAKPRVTLVARAGWEWAAARGPVELIGPDDSHSMSDTAFELLLRQIYLAAGGNHPDLNAYDDVMRTERRCAVLVHPDHMWTNPPGSQHQETSNEIHTETKAQP